MIEGGHPVDWVCGSSIGSVMAAAIAMYVDPQEIIDRGRSAFVDGHPFSDPTLPATSLLSGRRLERLLGTHPGGRMRNRPVGRVVAVDVTSRQDYRVDYESVPSPWAVLAGRYLPMRRRYRVPGIHDRAAQGRGDRHDGRGTRQAQPARLGATPCRTSTCS
jgi:predicted acylesterase/phospholipase RssA